MALYRITVKKSLPKSERMQIHAALIGLGGVPFFDPQDSGPAATVFVLDTYQTGEWFESKVRGAVARLLPHDVQVEVRNVRK